MALRYQTLAALSDRELAARGLRRQDIPRAVLGALGTAPDELQRALSLISRFASRKAFVIGGRARSSRWSPVAQR